MKFNVDFQELMKIPLELSSLPGDRSVPIFSLNKNSFDRVDRGYSRPTGTRIVG